MRTSIGRDVAGSVICYQDRDRLFVVVPNHVVDAMPGRQFQGGRIPP